MLKGLHRFDCSETHPSCQELRGPAANQGVADPDNLPFMLCPPGAEAAALLVHGFTGTPWEMRPLAEELAESGIASLAVRLPGHGTTPEDLAGRRWEEWLQAVIDGYRRLGRDFDSIYGMGMSTGCLLLLAMAQSSPLRGLVLFSPYLRVQHRLAPFAGWLRWVYPYHDKKAGNGMDSHYYNRRPVAGIHQINRLIKAVGRQLPLVTCPTLAFNGLQDETVDIGSGRRLFESLGSPLKIYAQYGPGVPHVLTGEENPFRRAMFLQTIRFVQELEGGNPEQRVR